MSCRPLTLYEKIWNAHVVERRDDGTCLIYVDRHLVHEVTSPQAFEGLRAAGRKVRRPDLTLAVPDHNLRDDARGSGRTARGCRSRTRRAAPSSPRWSATSPNSAIPYFDDLAAEQGIVHVVGPEQGFTLPGTTLVCGDSHTAAHGALGALAFGIGTSEVEHVLATQTLQLRQSKTLEIRVDGTLGFGVAPKDLILAHHRPDRHRRRQRPRHRISRLDLRGDEHRGPADRRQHVDRGAARARACSRRTRRPSPI